MPRWHPARHRPFRNYQLTALPAGVSEVLARLFRDLCHSKRLNAVDVVWHGGEVTLLPIAYVRKPVWLQHYFAAPGVTFANCIQTNATRLTPEWVTFFRDYEFSVGVSIDGPPEVHDSRRLTKSGKPTWHDVKAGMDLLKESGIPYGALAVVDKCVLELGADAYLSYLHKLGIKGLAFLNAIPSNSELYLSADELAFLNRVVEKARADVKSAGQSSNAEWEWTYRF